jgi:hypothetical protein
MPHEEIPKMTYLGSITADNAGDNQPILEYPNLYRDVRDNAEYNGRRIDTFYDQELGSIEELAKARQLAFEYWVATADKVVESGPQNRDLWAERYTNASVELFGAPDKAEAAREIGHQQTAFEAMRDDPNVDQARLDLVLSTYAPIVAEEAAVIGDEVDQQHEANFKQAVAELRQVITERYEPVMQIVDAQEQELFDQPAIVRLFSDALAVMADIDDPVWKDWKVVTNKSTAISVAGKEQEIRIPKNRAPIDATEAKKLLAHELLTHGLRSKNGSQPDNPRMLTGFPNYLDGEEPIAILMGAAGSDEKVSATVHDRYVDIALAMGVIGEQPKKRSELYDLAYTRKLVRLQHSGEPVNETALQKATSKYVDRIYRGSPGDDIGERQAVYTADIYYYRYKAMANYIAEQLAAGHNMNDLFDYMMQGKFDPTNSFHTDQVGQPSKS